MEEQIVQRINFIEREPFVLTYRRMMEIAGVVVGCCLLMFALQTVRVRMEVNKMAAMEAEIKTLREESDRLFRQMSTSGGTQTAREALASIFEKTPAWAALLKELTATAPRSVWLTSLKSRPGGEISGTPGLEISGRSEEAGAVAKFLKSLTSSSFFQNVVLASSKRDTVGGAVVYSFVIDLSVASPEGKGL